MATKLIFASLMLCVVILYGCNKQSKTRDNLNEVTQISEENMEKDGNCLVINDIPFEGKERFFKHIEKDRVTFYREGRTGGYWELYTDESTPFIFPILSYWLNKKGYEAVPDNIFKERLKFILDIDISTLKKCDKLFVTENYIEYVTYQTRETEGDIITEGEFLFSPKYHLFFRPEFNGSIVEEIGQTQRYQTCFPENLYHYNKYLFNDDKSSLNWLLKNDIDFLEILVREFGYDKESKINKQILNSICKQYNNTQPRNLQLLDHLFADKGCNGQLQIREGLLKTVAEETTTENYLLFQMLDDYGFTFINSKDEEDPLFTFAEKCKIIAYINNTTYPVFLKYREPGGGENWNFRSQLYLTIQYENIVNEIVKNNYYGLPNLRKYMEAEQEQYRVDQPNPEDYIYMQETGAIIQVRKEGGRYVRIDPC